MKKTFAFLSILLITIVSLVAGALPYSLENDFTIDDLIFNNYDLNLEDDLIWITPPEKSIQRRDRIIETVAIPNVEEFDQWLAILVQMKDASSYQDTYNYIANVLGEGTSENNTRFYLDRYSEEPEEEMLAGMLFTGKLGEYLAKALPAMYLRDLFYGSEAEYSHINMWVNDEYTVFTFEYEEGNAILYVHSGVVDELINNLITMLFSEGMDDF